MLTPEQRTQRARVAAYARWSQHDPKPAMAKVRQGYMERFEDEVDPDRQLSEAERNRRALAALRSHMHALALASSKARAKTDDGAAEG